MKKVFLLLMFFCIAGSVYAQDQIVFSTNQTEFYFYVGEEAVVPVNVSNSYDSIIDGQLQYTIIQNIQQQGVTMSSSNSQSNPLSIPKDPQLMGFNLGTSNNPAEITLALNYVYSDPKGKQVTTKLDGIKVLFIAQNEQKQDQQQEKQSESQTEEQQKKEQAEEQKKQQQQQEEQLRQQQAQNQLQNRVANNQMGQDANAIKQQMQKEMEKQKQTQEQFRRNVEAKPEVQALKKELEDQGYNFTGFSTDASDNSTGNFSMDFDKQNIEKAQVSGQLDNDELKSLQKTSTEDFKKLLDQLKNSTEFQKLDQDLQKDLFLPTNITPKKDGNITEFRINYQKDNETASIIATFQDETLKKVELEKDGNKRFWLVLILVSVIVVCFLAMIIYRRLHRKEISQEKIIEKPIDYRKEARRILAEAEELFKKNKEKDAYGKSAEAIRFYYSYDLGIKTELTNHELIKVLKQRKIDLKDTQECLNLTSLVEFAKYRANKDDFSSIIEIAEKIIR